VQSWQGTVASADQPGQRDFVGAVEPAGHALPVPVLPREEPPRTGIPVRTNERTEARPRAPLDGVVVRLPSSLLPSSVRSREHPADFSRQVDVAPVVVVNIGRIEVRATTPTAAATPPPPRKPAAVSLEDYLQPRRRNR
jgi:hypothetical protein